MKELLVVKYGSSTVTNETGMDQQRLDEYARQLALLSREHGLIVVSSGAAAAGKARWNSLHEIDFVESDQPFAMLGSAEVVTSWQAAFCRQSLLASQLLVTHRELKDPAERGSMIGALRNSLNHGIIPVVNENDALSDEELAKLAYGGDNDGLAARIAVTMGSKALILLTSEKGLLDAERAVVPRVEASCEAWQAARALAGKAAEKGRGGMETKVEAAIEAARHGIDVHIALAGTSFEEVLSDQNGTHFVAQTDGV